MVVVVAVFAALSCPSRLRKNKWSGSLHQKRVTRAVSCARMYRQDLDPRSRLEYQYSSNKLEYQYSSSKCFTSMKFVLVPVLHGSTGAPNMNRSIEKK